MSNGVYVDSRGTVAVAHYFYKMLLFIGVVSAKKKKIDQRWNLFSPKTGNPY